MNRLPLGILAFSLAALSTVALPSAEVGTLPCSGDLDVSEPASEVVQNGEFNDDLTEWPVSPGAASPSVSALIRHGGNQSARVKAV